jgi:photosystem II stability/assembly factor-like uncharacterized protein
MKYFYMKYLVPLFCLCLVVVSCSKKDTPAPAPPPVVLPDTLTAGWSKVIIDANDAQYGDIFFTNNSTGYVVGYNGYKTTDGGLSWVKIINNTGVSNLSVTPNGKVFIVTGGDSVLRSADGGVSFSRYALNAGGAYDIYFTGNDTGYVPAGSKLMRTVDGGLSWAPVSPVTGYPAGAVYKGVFFLNANLGWITFDNRLYKTNGNAGSWVQANFATAPAGAPASIFAYDASVAYAGFLSGVYKSTDGGTNFVKLPLDVNNSSFVDVHFINNNTGYVCCGRKIYKTTDGGNTWQTVVALGKGEIVEIHFTDASHGWACGSNGTVLLLR